jgi:hypothetical protein
MIWEQDAQPLEAGFDSQGEVSACQTTGGLNKNSAE